MNVPRAALSKRFLAATSEDGVPCPACDGLGQVDDRGFALRGQPYFDVRACTRCDGTGHALYVVGFEGPAGDDAPVAFGAAALAGKTLLINPTLGTVESMDTLDKLVQEGAIERVPKFAISIHRRGDPLYVLRFLRDDPTLDAAIFPEVKDLPSWLGGSSGGSTQTKYRFVLFPSLDALLAVGSIAAARLRQDAAMLTKCALVLDPWEGLGREEWLKTHPHVGIR